jgi:hypothetical protein
MGKTKQNKDLALICKDADTEAQDLAGDLDVWLADLLVGAWLEGKRSETAEQGSRKERQDEKATLQDRRPTAGSIP